MRWLYVGSEIDDKHTKRIDIIQTSWISNLKSKSIEISYCMDNNDQIYVDEMKELPQQTQIRKFTTLLRYNWLIVHSNVPMLIARFAQSVVFGGLLNLF